MRVVVDIGPMKTGTTALARYLLFAADRDLLPENVLYPAQELWFNRSRQTVELVHLDPRAATSSEGIEKRDTVRQALDGVVRATRERFGNDGTAVFIAETLGMQEDATWVWDEFTSRFDEVTFVLNARRQDAAVSSIITQRVKSTSNPAWSLSLHDNLATEPRTLEFYDYAEQLERWKPTTSTGKLEIFPVFEADNDPYRTVRNLFSVAGFGTPRPINQFEKVTFNASPSDARMREISKLKQKAAKAGPQSRKSASYLERVTKVRALAQADKKTTPWRLPLDERLRVLEYFVESNKTLMAAVQTDSRTANEWSQWQKTGFDILDRTRAEARLRT